MWASLSQYAEEEGAQKGACIPPPFLSLGFDLLREEWQFPPWLVNLNSNISDVPLVLNFLLWPSNLHWIQFSIKLWNAIDLISKCTTSGRVLKCYYCIYLTWQKTGVISYVHNIWLLSTYINIHPSWDTAVFHPEGMFRYCHDNHMLNS